MEQLGQNDGGEKDFKEYLQLEPAMFDEVMGRVWPHVEKTHTWYRDPLPPRLKLAVTLHYLATGNSIWVTGATQHYFTVHSGSVPGYNWWKCRGVEKSHWTFCGMMELPSCLWCHWRQAHSCKKPQWFSVKVFPSMLRHSYTNPNPLESYYAMHSTYNPCFICYALYAAWRLAPKACVTVTKYDMKGMLASSKMHHAYGLLSIYLQDFFSIILLAVVDSNYKLSGQV